MFRLFPAVVFSIFLSLVCYPLVGVSALLVLSDTDDDATITLSIEEQVEIGTTGWASLQVDVKGDDVALSAGDKVTVDLIEDDGGLGDDSIFSLSFIVSAVEAAAGFFSRMIDAVFDPTLFIPDAGEPNKLEIVAKAIVEKDACSFGCFFDRPETPIANVSFFDTLPPPSPPGPEVVSDQDGDTKLTLSILEEVVIGSSDWASISIEVSDDDAPLTLGDTILIELIDDDGGLGDDLLFSSLLEVTAAEVVAGEVNRLINADFDPTLFLPDTGFNNILDIYARAEVNKDACGLFLCRNDRPQTSIVNVNFVESTAVSEPSIIVLFAAGLWGMGFARRRKE